MQTDFVRILLWGALFAMAFMLWNAWHLDYAEKAPTQLRQNANISFPSSASQPASNLPTVSSTPIRVQTDVLNVAIDPIGGNLIEAELLKYPQEKDSQKPIHLLNPDPARLYLAQSSLVTPSGTQPFIYQSPQSAYQLNSNQDTLLVKLMAKGSDKIWVEKIFNFKKGSYLIGVDYRIHNQSPQVFTGYLDERLVRKKVAPPSKGLFHINPYIGAAYSTPATPFEKLGFEDMAKADLNQEVKSGWIAMLQLYFLSAWIPDKNQSFHFYSQELGNDVYAIGMQSPHFTLTPNGQYSAHSDLYIGPAISDVLNSIAPHLGLAVNYGWLWFISEWLFWFLKQIHSVIGNWGWAIVILTALIKLVFYHLSAKSYRSMAKMRQLQPRLEALKKRHGDDKQKLMQETMELYKKERVNPMGGCLPILVQIPVFIALYWVLLESVELYQAPFILWIRDLSSPDPYYILPLLMGITMFIQQKLSPPPPDPTQEKLMLLMPVIFTALFLYFPAGLVLYWVVNNALSILQQWYITKHYHPAKKSFKSK